MLDGDAESFLVRKILAGGVVLFLGAGGSHSTKNSRGQPIPKRQGLAALFRGIVGQNAVDLDLGEIAEDAKKPEGSAEFQLWQSLTALRFTWSLL